MWYEVDLVDRRTGQSVECIYSGEDYEKAYEVADNWNRKNLADYDEEIGFCDYVDWETEGLSADLYVVEEEIWLHGVGKFGC